MSSLRNRIYIDLIDAEDSVDKEYKLTPYVLGVYLGMVVVEVPLIR